jgi:hypothetical protein
MAKTTRLPRARRSRSETPSVAQAHESTQATSASLTKLLANVGPYPGSVLIQSGIAHDSGQLYNAPVGWWGMAYKIDAPPPGQVLWFTLAFNWQIWTWNCFGPGNDSSSQKRVDFGASWRWELIANPYYFPEPLPRFMTDFGRYEFYSSVSPGGSGFNAAWIVPARSVTLTPDSKESDPTPLELLLGTQVSGKLRVWCRGNTSDLIVNGQQPYAYTIGGRPDGLYWSYAVRLSRFHDVGSAIENPVRADQ